MQIPKKEINPNKFDNYRNAKLNLLFIKKADKIFTAYLL